MTATAPTLSPARDIDQANCSTARMPGVSHFLATRHSSSRLTDEMKEGSATTGTAAPSSRVTPDTSSAASAAMTSAAVTSSRAPWAVPGPARARWSSSRRVAAVGRPDWAA